MLSWLSNLDPNFIAGLIGVVVSVFRARNATKTEGSLASALSGVLRQKVAELFLAPGGRERARQVLDEAATALLSQLKIKRSAAINLIISGAIEHALADLAERLADHDATMARLDRGLAELDKNVQGALDVFGPKATP